MEGQPQNPIFPMTLETTLRVLRLLWGVLLFSILLFPVIGEAVGTREPKDVRLIQLGLACLSLVLIVVASLVRLKMVQPATEILSSRSDDAAALKRWQTGSILSYVMFESVVLYGFVFRMMGASLYQAAPFYLAGVLLMILWWPRRP